MKSCMSLHACAEINDGRCMFCWWQHALYLPCHLCFKPTAAQPRARAHLHKLARELLQLALAEQLGVDGYAALGAAEWDVHHRRFPGHQRRQAARQNHA